MSIIVTIGAFTLLVVIILINNALITITIAVSVVIYLLRKKRIKTLIVAGVAIAILIVLLMLGLGVFGPIVTTIIVSEKVLTTPFVFQKQMAYFRFDEYPYDSLEKDDVSSIMFLAPYDSSIVENLVNYYPDVSVTIVPPGTHFILLKLLSIDSPWYHFDQINYMTVLVQDRDVIMEVMLHDLPEQVQNNL